MNKEGRIEVKETPQDEFDGGMPPSAGTPLNDNTSESLPTANTTADIEQIQQDISATTDITASPTDSYPPNDVSLDESGVASGNSSALVASSGEVSTQNHTFLVSMNACQSMFTISLKCNRIRTPVCTILKTRKRI